MRHRTATLAAALFSIMATIFSVVPVPAEVWPGVEWQRATPEKMGMDAGLLEKARDYALQGEGSGYITRRGVLVIEWGDSKQRYDLKSSTKSFGATALGVALLDGKFADIHDPAKKYHPAFGAPPEGNIQTGWLDKITLFHLATQTAGFDKPGGYTQLLFEPGSQWSYSDGGPNWLAECVTLVYGQDLNTMMFERVFTPLGIRPDDLTWRKNSYRDKELNGVERREFGSGIHANVNAMARVGLLYLRRGQWKGKRILSESFIDAARTVPESVRGIPVFRSETYPDASRHYGLLWWNNADGALENVPRDAYWSWGLYDSLIIVIPSLDIVASRAGKSLPKSRGAHYDPIRPLIEPIALSVSAPAPYPPHPTARLTWAPSSTIVRLAEGSDNWPITWADDGDLYTAYGDGWGFEPKVPEKLSLGLCRVAGVPDDIQGFNIRSSSGEQKGQGAKGIKASGMLSVGGVLYMWARNAANSQLATSNDRGKTWKWSDWKFTKSFACPTFLNFGKDYAGARDQFVYIYSFDSDSAYEPADRMVMARVAKERIGQREAYEFLQRVDPSGAPVWTKNIDKRGAVFEHKGRCYRSGVSHNPAIGLYLWAQVFGDEPRFKGGLGVYAAPEPWGPWTTLTFTEEWDVGPGETASFPPKWMNANTLHLVFSGDDHFSVRRARLRLKGANDK